MVEGRPQADRCHAWLTEPLLSFFQVLGCTLIPKVEPKQAQLWRKKTILMEGSHVGHKSEENLRSGNL